jgi:hypothetical protein
MAILLKGGENMRDHTKNYAERKQALKRIIALVVLICFMLISLFSTIFILSHSHHEHDHNGAGGSCATCTKINNTENTLKQLITAVGSAAFSPISLFAVMPVLYTVLFIFGFKTLVRLKIQMNN